VADCLLVVIGTGIAGVIVSGATVLRGAIGLAGEVGHMPVHPDGELCACGQRGCLETYASATAIARRYRAAGGSDAADAPAVVAARGSDPIAVRVWQEATAALGIALAGCTMLLDPAVIVLGGGLAGAGDALLVPVRTELGHRLTWRAVPPVELSPLGPNAGLFGAAILAWQSVGADLDTWTRAPALEG
jgi:glucokinase